MRQESSDKHRDIIVKARCHALTLMFFHTSFIIMPEETAFVFQFQIIVTYEFFELNGREAEKSENKSL